MPGCNSKAWNGFYMALAPWWLNQPSGGCMRAARRLFWQLEQRIRPLLDLPEAELLGSAGEEAPPPKKRKGEVGESGWGVTALPRLQLLVMLHFTSLLVYASFCLCRSLSSSRGLPSWMWASGAMWWSAATRANSRGCVFFRGQGGAWGLGEKSLWCDVVERGNKGQLKEVPALGRARAGEGGLGFVAWIATCGECVHMRVGGALLGLPACTLLCRPLPTVLLTALLHCAVPQLTLCELPLWLCGAPCCAVCLPDTVLCSCCGVQALSEDQTQLYFLIWEL